MANTNFNMDEILQGVLELGRFGDNATFRRVYSLLASYAAHTGTGKPEIKCHNPHLPPTLTPFGFDRTLHETQQDQMRRSVFLDPEEAFIANLMDFLCGRIAVLEFRNPDKKYDIRKFEEIARKRLKGRVPVVAVNMGMAQSIEEVVFTLRHIANELENGSAEAFASKYAEAYKGDPVTIQDHCTFERRESFGSRWSSNGTVLEYHYHDVYSCLPADTCCTNQAYTEYRNDRWVEVWRDGNPSAPPPTSPNQIPDFSSSPWNNRIPLLTDQTIGTWTSDYGWRRLRQDGSYIRDFHPGIDVGAAAGSNVQSNVDGTVVWINSAGDAAHPENRGVIVLDGTGVTHTYWHINPSTTLNVNDPVSQGDRLGTIYDWGNRTHLHYGENTPPQGDWRQRNDANSRNPLP